MCAIWDIFPKWGRQAGSCSRRTPSVRGQPGRTGHDRGPPTGGPPAPPRTRSGCGKKKEPPPCGLSDSRLASPSPTGALENLLFSGHRRRRFPHIVNIVFREKRILILLRRSVGMIRTPPLSHPPIGLLDENPRPESQVWTQFSREHECQHLQEEDPCSSPLRPVNCTARTTGRGCDENLQDVWLQYVIRSMATPHPTRRARNHKRNLHPGPQIQQPVQCQRLAL